MGFYLESSCKKDCYRCNACVASCKLNAISMEYDNKSGYYYPKINYDKCVKCGKCKRVCINVNKDYLYSDIKKAYIIKNNDDKVRENSASGGISDLLVKYVLDKKGIVYGAIFNDNHEVIHARLTNYEEAKKMRKSKYVASNINGIYTQVIDDLKDDKWVLFTGTPCQIAGLKATAISKKLTDKLILCEIMCDCVASPLLLKKYITYLEDKYQTKLKELTFRCKDNGAHTISGMIEFTNGKKEVLSIKEENVYSEYMYMYGCGLSAPDSCLDCEYEKTNKRTADFTIGDYWGKKELLKDDNRGLSLLFLNSKKAIDIFNDYISNNCSYVKTQPLQALECNHKQAKGYILNRNKFIKDLEKLSFDQLADKYYRRKKTKRKISKYIPKSIKKIIKRVWGDK